MDKISLGLVVCGGLWVVVASYIVVSCKLGYLVLVVVCIDNKIRDTFNISLINGGVVVGFMVQFRTKKNL